MSTDQRRLFEKLVVGFLAQRGFAGEVRDDGTFDGGATFIALEGLAGECGSIAEEDWPVHIARALGTELAAQIWARERDVRDDTVRALELLRPRLWARHVVDESEGPPLVHRPWLPGIYQGLCLALDDRVASVFEADAERWGLPLDELFARAEANLRDDPLLVPSVEPLERLRGERGGLVFSLKEGPPGLSSHAVILSRYLPEAVPRGALFVLPHDRVVAYHAIADGPSLHRAIVRLATYAHRAFANAPHPLSPHLYWWFEGRMQLLPMHHGPESVSFQPPDTFVDEVLVPLDALVPPED